MSHPRRKRLLVALAKKRRAQANAEEKPQTDFEVVTDEQIQKVINADLDDVMKPKKNGFKKLKKEDEKTEKEELEARVDQVKKEEKAKVEEVKKEVEVAKEQVKELAKEVEKKEQHSTFVMPFPVKEEK